MHLRSGRLVTSSEEQSNSKSESSSESHSSPQSHLNIDPPPQDELRQAIAEHTARLGHLKARYDEDNAHYGRNNNRHGPHPRNPQVYNDWVQEKEHFFEWYDFSEDKKVRFAKMKLVGRAKLQWDSVVNHLCKTRQPPITLWEEIKAKFNENYFPVSHQGNLLDQWHYLRQDNRSTTEYVEQFEEYRIHSNATEDEPITFSRFRKGINYDLQRELMARQISTLDDAYTLVQDLELIPRPQGGRRFDNLMLPHNNFEGPQGRYLQGAQNRPYPNYRHLHIEDNPQGRYQQGHQNRPNPINRPLRPEYKGKSVAYLDTLATTSSLPPITCTYERQRRHYANLVSLWLDGACGLMELILM
ncbi:hypothetical protein CMV_000101 [Castanea mollissima]|uniref:Retrotransposon gag domain-containing protein n=1 Tax=Castanea mollissima TaxID=60419 RepID=A0A8J4S1X2_9ROSI|nr:hypothetical protein CMV_000101 [Castanea mollissima]